MYFKSKSIIALSLTTGLVLSQAAQQNPDNSPHIVGGYEVKPPFKYPWMVSIYIDGKHGCGGTLYNDDTVITAAHCVGGNVNRYLVLVHRHNLTKTNEEEKGVSLKVKQINVHPDYNNLGKNDIAVLKLDKSYASKKPKIDLDVENLSAKTDTLTKTIGWGDLTEGGESSEQLMEVKVPIFDIAKCVQNYKRINMTVDPKAEICASYPEGGKDSCQSDSGGPLFIENYGKSVLLGVVSWGRGCARPNLPGVYAKVHTYVDWIKKYI